MQELAAARETVMGTMERCVLALVCIDVALAAVPARPPSVCERLRTWLRVYWGSGSGSGSGSARD